MEFLGSILCSGDLSGFIPDPNFIGNIIKWLYGLIGNYGWTVVVFTLFLKLITSPLDFWQRYTMKKNSLKMSSVQDRMEKIQKQFANDQRRLNEEKQKILKKEGYSNFASCLPMIITMVIFIIMFNGLNSYSKYINFKNYTDLYDSYITEYNDFQQTDDYKSVYDETYATSYDGKYSAELLKDYSVAKTEKINQLLADNSEMDQAQAEQIADDYIEQLRVENAQKRAKNDAALKANVLATTSAKMVAGEFYTENIQESFLWVHNLWRADTWVKQMADSNTFKSGGTGMASLEGEAAAAFNPELYDIIYEGVLEQNPGYFASFDENGKMERNDDGELKAGWNGLIILPLLSVIISMLSTFVTQKQQKAKGGIDMGGTQAQSTNKMLTFLMPIMFGVFGFIYTGAFALYMVSNSLITLIINFSTNGLLDKKAQKNAQKQVQEHKASYMR